MQGVGLLLGDAVNISSAEEYLARGPKARRIQA
jgi:hypothetical protein